MLYVTTRNQVDIFSPEQTLAQSRAGDGGFFVPLEASSFSPQEIARLGEVSFNQCLADMLNRMFDKKLTAWDMDFCIGRYPVRLRELGGRIVMGETWHNPHWCFQAMVQRLTGLLGGEGEKDWPELAVRIAVLFGVYGELLRQKILKAGETMDVSAMAGDLMAPVSAWYARQWGLPVGSIICCCNENNGLWNLICHGQMHTDTLSIPTFLPSADVPVPAGLERLISACGGVMELEAYLECCRTGRLYVPDVTALERLRKGLYVSVVSSQRIAQTIPNVYATHGYLTAPSTALAYAGLLDYRAKKGKLRCCVVLADDSPISTGSVVAQAMGVTEKRVKDML